MMSLMILTAAAIRLLTERQWDPSLQSPHPGAAHRMVLFRVKLVGRNNRQLLQHFLWQAQGRPLPPSPESGSRRMILSLRCWCEGHYRQELTGIQDLVYPLVAKVSRQTGMP